MLDARVTAGNVFAGLLCRIIGFGEYVEAEDEFVDVVDVGLGTLPIEEYFNGVFFIIDFNEVGVEDGLKGFAKFLFSANGEGFVYNIFGFFFFLNLSSILTPVESERTQDYFK